MRGSGRLGLQRQGEDTFDILVAVLACEAWMRFIEHAAHRKSNFTRQQRVHCDWRAEQTTQQQSLLQLMHHHWSVPTRSTVFY